MLLNEMLPGLHRISSHWLLTNHAGNQIPVSQQIGFHEVIQTMDQSGLTLEHVEVQVISHVKPIPFDGVTKQTLISGPVSDAGRGQVVADLLTNSSVHWGHDHRGQVIWRTKWKFKFIQNDIR